MFQQQYVSEALKAHKQVDFDLLEQRNMSVREYEHKFNCLLKYAPLYDGLEEFSAKRCIWGLRLEFRQILRAIGIKNYYEAVQRVLTLEKEFHHPAVGNIKGTPMGYQSGKKSIRERL